MSTYQGSSPQARGAPHERAPASSAGGLIPAGAGSTRRLGQGGVRVEAHPRRRGEHHVARAGRDVSSGSSPQARGARYGCGDGPAPARLIPAGAGSTGVTTRSVTTPGAHPRRRGEHGGTPQQPQVLQGSSPQARGAPANTRHAARSSGLIPAGAGSTHALHVEGDHLQAHPRRRGEHYNDRLGGALEQGSSPQARGARRGRR